MRIYLEKMREIEQKRQGMEKAAFEFAFKDWFTVLSEEEIVSFLPTEVRRLKNSPMREALAKEHFKNNLWLQKIKEIENTNL